MADKFLANEKELAAAVVAWLQGMGWEVYQEVACYSAIADIVAVMEPRLWVVECKMSLGFPVMAQAVHWKNFAHMVSVAVPGYCGSRGYDSNHLAKRCCEMLDLGVIEVSGGYGFHRISVTEKIAPKHNRNLITGKDGSKGIRPYLHEEQKSMCAAGGNRGGYYTPFKATCKGIFEYVKQHPGCTLKDLVDNVNMHYDSPKSAKSAIPTYLERNIIPGVRGEKECGKWRVYPAEEAGSEVAKC